MAEWIERLRHETDIAYIAQHEMEPNAIFALQTETPINFGFKVVVIPDSENIKLNAQVQYTNRIIGPMDNENFAYNENTFVQDVEYAMACMEIKTQYYFQQLLEGHNTEESITFLWRLLHFESSRADAVQLYTAVWEDDISTDEFNKYWNHKVINTYNSLIDLPGMKLRASYPIPKDREYSWYIIQDDDNRLYPNLLDSNHNTPSSFDYGATLFAGDGRAATLDDDIHDGHCVEFHTLESVFTILHENDDLLYVGGVDVMISGGTHIFSFDHMVHTMMYQSRSVLPSKRQGELGALSFGGQYYTCVRFTVTDDEVPAWFQQDGYAYVLAGDVTFESFVDLPPEAMNMLLERNI